MSQTNPKYKRLEALLSEARPADPDPTRRPENSEVEALKDKVASLEAEREENRAKPRSKAISSEPIATTFEAKPVMPEAANEKQVDELNARNAYRVVLAFIAVQFFIVGFLVFQTIQTPTWQLWAMDGLGVSLMIFEIVGLVYVRRGRHELGIWLSFMPFLIVLFVIPLLYSGLGLLFLVSALTITTLVGSLTLSPRQSVLFIRIGIMVGAADLLMDLYIPFQRTTLPGFQNIIYFALAFLLLVLSYTVVRQFRDYSLRTKLLLGFLSVLVLASLTGVFAIQQQSGTAETTAVTETFNLAETLSGIVTLNQVDLQQLVTQIHESQGRDMEVVGPDLRVLADAKPEDIGTIVEHDQNGEVAATLKDGQTRTFVEISPDYPQGSKQVVVPIRDESGKISGAVILEYTSLYDELQRSANTATRSLIALGLAGLLLAFVISQVISTSIANPISQLSSAALKIGNGQLDTPILLRPSNDEVGILASAFKNMTAQLRSLIGSLEQRVAERTLDLEVAAEVGRAVSEKSADIYGLLKDAVQLISERFHLYYAQIYLADTAGRTLTLRAGSGEVGAELLRRGHSLSLDSTSINGRAAAERVAAIVSDTAQSANFRPNPLLPNTRSEMAIPLIAGGKVVGVLDMQSTFAGALNETNLPAFEALAGQLAIALQNAALFAEAEQSRAEMEAQARRLTRTGWADYLNAIQRPERTGYVFDQNKMMSIDEAEASHTPSDHALTAPIAITGVPVGTFSVELEGQEWDAGTKEFINTVARQMAQQIENLRLLETAQQYRSEAENVVRRLTREGWQGYLDAKSSEGVSYLYDLKEVKSQDKALDQKTNGPVLSLPLKVRDETIGKLSVFGLETHDLDSLELAGLVAERLSAHIENLRLSDQNEKRADELAAVATVSTTASTVLDPDKLLQAVVDLTKERFNLYHTHIYLADNSWNTLFLAAGAGEVGRQMVATGHAIQIDTERSLVARASRERKSIIVNDVRAEAGFLPNSMLPETRSEMAVPMIAGDKVIGVFDVQADTLGHFTDEDANIYTTLATQVAVALQNARLYVEQAATVTQLRELDKLKSSFLANMSHELRTPLNSILGFADVMLEGLDGPLSDNMNNDLGLIQKNGQHLLHLINDVLDMAKIDSGKMNLNVEKFNVHELLTDVTSITSSLAKEKSLALIIESDSDHEVEINADKVRLRQVMINLVNNAMKFTDKGSISIRATRENKKVLISVKDTGIGISLDHLETVFQEFTQVDTTTTRKAGGTGLGLPISRRLINMHSGRLWAESTGINGEGSTFYVTLPIEANINEDATLTAK